MIEKNGQCCGTCKWRANEMDDSWICFNDESEHCADWAEYDDCCPEWEDRNEID